MNTYRTSLGERIRKSVIDRRIREAKRISIERQLDRYGYNFCEKCGGQGRLDCSHIKSVDQCQKDGESEKAYDPDNIQILCRKCHQAYDRNGIMNPKIENPGSE